MFLKTIVNQTRRGNQVDCIQAQEKGQEAWKLTALSHDFIENIHEYMNAFN